MKLKYLFLHYGPGASAHVERQWLAQGLPQVEFWDQPRLPDSQRNCQGLLEACAQKLESLTGNSKIGLIGHSFGTELAARLAIRYPDKIAHIILLSPIRTIPQIFVNMAGRMLELHADAGLKEKRHQIASLDGKSMEQIRQETWDLIGAMLSHPSFNDSYFCDTSIAKRFKETSAQAPSLDFELWKTVINLRFLVEPPFKEMLQLPIPTQAVLGEKDPYYNITEEKQFWGQLLKPKDLFVISNCGHFPHLESQVLSQLIKA